MAHGDYDCCAICDCKMDYAASEARTKEDLCIDCLRSAHKAGVMVYDGTELEAWIKANPAEACAILPSLGFSKCWYPNPVDDAAIAAFDQEPAP